jgi:hypothetical protein
MKYLIIFFLITNLYSSTEYDTIDPEKYPDNDFCVALDKKSKVYINFSYYPDIKDFMFMYDIHKVYIKDCSGSAWKVLKRDTSKCEIHKDNKNYLPVKNKYLINAKI